MYVYICIYIYLYYINIIVYIYIYTYIHVYVCAFFIGFFVYFHIHTEGSYPTPPSKGMIVQRRCLVVHQSGHTWPDLERAGTNIKSSEVGIQPWEPNTPYLRNLL